MDLKLQSPVQAQLTREFSPVELSVRSKAVQEKINETIKNGGLNSAERIDVDLSRLSGENRLLAEDTSPCRKVTVDSSSFVDRNYDNMADDAVFKIDGVNFSKKEVENAQKVIRCAASYLPTVGSNLSYGDYASMGIAINSVSAWADNNLTAEQSSVIKKSITDYTDLMTASERENQKNMGVSIDDSKYYGATVSNEETDKMINQMREQMSKFTGNTYAPSYGNVVSQQSATNRELTSAVKDLFANIDLQDANSVKEAYSKYKEMATPAYNSIGITNQQNGLQNVLRQDISNLAKQISGSNALLANIRNSGVDITA
jgi:hypothetical protein